mgnify:FL=1
MTYGNPHLEGPLGQYAIAGSQVQTPGWKPLEGPETPFEQVTGGGGGGFGFSLGGQRPYNDMEKTILAHDYPGGFKVATDQYAAKYSDQLDEWAKEELKEKYPTRDWDAEYKRTAALKNNYYNTGELWGPKGPTGRTENTPNIVKKKIAPTIKTPLGSYRDRDGLSSVFSRNKQNKSAIASRPRSTSDMYSRFGRGR